MKYTNHFLLFFSLILFISIDCILKFPPGQSFDPRIFKIPEIEPLSSNMMCIDYNLSSLHRTEVISGLRSGAIVVKLKLQAYPRSELPSFTMQQVFCCTEKTEIVNGVPDALIP
ncbi:hypothetical protein KY290_014780 [Solanum tuberosum]|uniref:Uncharacterized protein n=1 Tax=Solanum tuberosum TaxID=4113 RepID=A0ABQ7VQP8_SOLTU|nr:hypothetical protein KY284_014185 [Solanum tuberosum]KAH0770799.1 hypothetical protein KY290_014780 [Solanum tuberosum]